MNMDWNPPGLSKFSKQPVPLGCEILEAEDGLEALKIILQDKQVPNLILLDLMMPCLTGMEFLTIFRGRPECDHIPVVVCT